MTLSHADLAAIEAAMSIGGAETPPELRRTVPTVSGSDPGIGRLYAAALKNVFAVNTVRNEDGAFVRAGGGYPTPWTRDAAINSWSALSLLAPGLAEATLRAVIETGESGPLVAQDDQWWDQVIWILAAERHAAWTDDTEFARWAYRVGRNSLEQLEQYRDPQWGLYLGPAVMQDGVAGFPLPDGAQEIAPFVLEHSWSRSIMCLSTNVLYAAAHDSLAALAARIAAPGDDLVARADSLRRAIEEHLWTGDRYAYLRRTDGRTEQYQELLGLALLLECGGIDDDRVRTIVEGMQRTPAGLALVWPHFSRYSDERPGRHNVALWPMAMGQWAVAAALRGQAAAFTDTWHDLRRLVEGSGGDFYELYSAVDGSVDGGWQTGRQWDSEPHQTWSATAFLRMVHEGVFGLRVRDGELRLEPTLPTGVEHIELRGLRLASARLTITVSGAGNVVEQLSLDDVARDDPGAPIALADLRGDHTLRVRVRP
ncbi:hypothetical protein [Bogoriella caseilytica]|uniref:Alpha-L-rhamnosidase six-hairpin glycosidase domain-containing protein n=1 Tax=Bogoriella caseilytica TaxID=56055 RepID=A0A3N2BDW7_9MICO|nr:hypothetical protein [Bogoriella caseilytica]ROR73447.1 hypothetical protein EDD31_1828 [Bogoriella caseilytica]